MVPRATWKVAAKALAQGKTLEWQTVYDIYPRVGSDLWAVLHQRSVRSGKASSVQKTHPPLRES